MSKECKALMLEIRQMIESIVAEFTDSLSDSKEVRGLDINQEDAEILKDTLLTTRQLSALKTVLEQMGIQTVFSLLCIVDGVTYTESEDIPDLALVNRATRENICEDFLHDAFCEIE